MKLYFRSLFCCVWTPADSLAVCSACCQLSIPNKNTPGTMEPTAAQTKKKNLRHKSHTSYKLFGIPSEYLAVGAGLYAPIAVRYV